MQYTWLDPIEFPEDLRKLPVESLPLVCQDLRQFIIDATSKNSGHLGANLGVVELTVALHYVLNTPYDEIVWDVGHQAYGHKILTGRKKLFYTNRKKGGLSGFPSMKESRYDSFGTGHSSTSVSAALGLAKAAALKGEQNRQVVAVMGDGSLTGGMVFEALNNAASSKTNLLIILNDNEMAIDPNVGGMRAYLTHFSASRTYNRMKADVWNSLRYARWLRTGLQKLENAAKSVLYRQGNLFEALGIRYFGPIDGHDVVALTRLLRNITNIPGPKLLHIRTIKGKGYKFAEDEQIKFHAPGLFNKETGKAVECCGNGEDSAMQDIFGKTLCQLAEKNSKILAITPAMGTGSGLIPFKNRFPDRFFDVGIAEPHAVTFAAGLAARGLTPFCCIYSSFLQRSYDQVIHDVALQKLPVVLCVDRAGLVGEDGSTHQGAYDLASLRCIPHLTLAAPMDGSELRKMMYTAQLNPDGPFVIRYPKAKSLRCVCEEPFTEVAVGRGRKLRDGGTVAFVTLGQAGLFAAAAADILAQRGLKVAHYDMRFLKPLDTELVAEICSSHSLIAAVEEGSVMGGFASAFIETMHRLDCVVKIKSFGIPDRYIAHGTQQEQLAECGIDAESLAAGVEAWLRSQS